MTESAPTADPRLAKLEDEAREARERFDELRTTTDGARPTSTTQLRKLQEAAGYAEARLERARRNA
jgi:predicted  nucleic acid-binding Zn-ribbon protein